jgi:ABC-type phosphate transport system substrate-binding protein
VGLGFEWDFDTVVAMLSIAIPSAAFVWEFAVVGRKRLGYRVQMDTLATDTAHSPYAGVLEEMHQNGTSLTDPSFVLLRIENAGWLPVIEEDYLTPADDPTGIRVTFPGRRVAGAVVTELSQPELRDFFSARAAGFGIDDELDSGVIRLPKVKLNPSAHYKVLAVLERRDAERRDAFPDPVFRADVSGRHSRWFGWPGRLARLRLARTESHTFASKPALVGIVLLAVAVLAQAGLTLVWREETPPLDCVGGTLRLHGSTAFAPAVRAAAERYVELCDGKGAAIPVDDGTFTGSGEGIAALEAVGAKAGDLGGGGLGDHLAFTDGPAVGSHPEVLPRPVAYSLFTLVVNEDAKVRNLTLDQIKGIYSGRYTHWSQVGGAPGVPIHLVNRHRGSGTRTALEQRVLGEVRVPEATADDCAALDADRPGACEVDNTAAVLNRTAALTGALGYSEVSGAASAPDLVQLRIDRMPPTLEGVEDGDYPYWQTEYAYTFGEPPSDSLAAAFLRYLTDQGGKDILREHGNRPCSETDYPLLCEPA